MSAHVIQLRLEEEAQQLDDHAHEMVQRIIDACDPAVNRLTDEVLAVLGGEVLANAWVACARAAALLIQRGGIEAKVPADVAIAAFVVLMTTRTEFFQQGGSA